MTRRKRPHPDTDDPSDGVPRAAQSDARRGRPPSADKSPAAQTPGRVGGTRGARPRGGAQSPASSPTAVVGATGSTDAEVPPEVARPLVQPERDAPAVEYVGDSDSDVEIVVSAHRRQPRLPGSGPSDAPPPRSRRIPTGPASPGDGHHAQAFVDLTLSQRAFYADGGEPGSFPANDPAHASIDLISDDESLGSVIVARQSAVLINLLDSDSDEVEFVGSLSPEIASDMITPCDLNELDLKIDDIGPPKRSLPALLMSREYLADALGHYEVQKIYETLETRSLTQWKRQIVYKFGSGGTTSLCFSPNAQMLLSTHSALTDTYNEPGNFICADIGLRRWSDREPEVVRRMTDPHYGVPGIAHAVLRSPADSSLGIRSASCSDMIFWPRGFACTSSIESHLIKLWDLENMAEEPAWLPIEDSLLPAGAKAGVSQMVVLSDDAFAAGSVGGAVYIWRDEAGFSTPECLRAKPEESVESFRAVSTVYVQPDLGPNILFAGYEQPALQARKDGNFKMWDVTRPRQPLLVVDIGKQAVSSLSWSPLTGLLAVGVEASGIVYAIGDSPTDQLVRFFDVRSHARKPSSLTKTRLAGQEGLDFSGRFHVRGRSYSRSIVDVFDMRFLDKPLATLEHDDSQDVVDHDVHSVALWTASGVLITGGTDCALRFWDVRRQNPLLNHIDDFDGSISSLALSFGHAQRPAHPQRQLSVDELEALDRRQRAATHASALQASTRSKHECYHASVQLPQEEVKSLSNMYQTVQRAVRRAGMRGGDGDLPPSDDDDTDSEADGADSLDAGRESLNARRMAKRQAPPVARTFLEDFCGTAVLADAWAGMHATHEAFGIDIDPAVIAHARAQTLQHAHSARVHVSVGNVLEPTAAYGVPPVDLIAALNYGVFYHHRRADLVKYLRRCADALNHGGVLIVDCFGGARVSSVEGRLFKRRFSDFTYFFEQKPMDALSSIVHVHLHFRFDDGSWLKNAFTYEFRVYTIREIREAMLEAGFARTFVWIGSSAEQRQASASAAAAAERDDNADVADRASEDDSDDEADEAGGTFKDRDAGVYEYKLVETLTVPQLESFNAYIAAVV
ncbi:hypothetical protein HK105_202133 [Polyrhizophydium stewartii]|uniref:Methyltransferase type 12 domain-containing protein n=1 Tax=Polyrhizophydium stewartii TaxID=2732419 RepID=A0ABR4NFB5_9FUNG